MRSRVTQHKSGRVAVEQGLWHPRAMLPHHPQPIPVCLLRIHLMSSVALGTCKWAKCFLCPPWADILVDVKMPKQKCRKLLGSSMQWPHSAMWKGSRQNPGSFLPGFERGNYLELILRHFLQVLLLVLQLDRTKLVCWVFESLKSFLKA